MNPEIIAFVTFTFAVVYALCIAVNIKQME